ncbi:hypothetical protein O6H91_10G026200 [Diphasiastrum complanatum]|uniref:Uncharacterized protein n=2 Tax=Diphasiastrum complanatum TaxID=34168 RepID=A0ACC2CG78_DIPCM|nr:hypothetical protein O6H91_10G026200 [Diphasiastrum complanatum]KAJ7540677.1 hypothetical protein O6H91_10G026200 [Diphasiastrum complanatum]
MTMGGMVQNLTESLATMLDAPLADAVVFGFHIDGHFLLETLLVVAIAFLLLQKSYQPQKRPLTEQEVDQLCEEWVPEPLHPPITKEMEYNPPVLESAAGPRTVVNGKSVINLSSTNYLGLIGNSKIKEACNAALEKYGVGSCGPRGFYGTIDVHLDLEAKIAQFLGTPDTILYSYGLATASSAIPAFCKRGDLIIADEGVSWGIQNGLLLSRSTIKYFKHNDISSLEKRLEEVFQEDQRKRKALNRRFIVVEAIYQNSGLMAPLDEIVRLKEKYRFRIFVDESNSIGIFGKNGRGLFEHLNIPVEKIDIIIAAMGNALASVGGFCSGSSKVVDHQRLSGAGYCFSASLPPFLASASIAAVEIIQQDRERQKMLQENVAFLRRNLSEIPGLTLGSDPLSPLVYLYLAKSSGSFAGDNAILQKIVDQMLEKSVLLTLKKRSVLDKCKLPTGIRIAVSASHEKSDLLAVSLSLKEVVQSILSS